MDNTGVWFGQCAFPPPSLHESITFTSFPRNSSTAKAIFHKRLVTGHSRLAATMHRREPFLPAGQSAALPAKQAKRAAATNQPRQRHQRATFRMAGDSGGSVLCCCCVQPLFTHPENKIAPRVRPLMRPEIGLILPLSAVGTRDF